MSTTRTLLSLGAAVLGLAASAPAQFGGLQLEAARVEPAGLFGPPPAFGEHELVDPVDVAVMSWSHTPVTWAFVADAGANQVVRYVITPGGDAVLPSAWTDWQYGPHGIAVNDLPDHPQQELVFVTGTSLAGQNCVQVYDKWGNDWPGNVFNGDPIDPFVDPRGIAVGPRGNVFVADFGRRVVEEFEGSDVANFNASTPVNRYGLFTNAVPFDVSVDLMRRVHVAANEYFPFADGLTEVYRYGEISPTAIIADTNRIVGIDAKGPWDTRYTWATGAFAEVRRLPWTATLWPLYTFGGAFITTVPTSGAAAEKAGGLELQRSWRVIGVDEGERVVECARRTYVSDRADGEVQVLSTTRQSVPRPDDAVAWWKLDEGSAGTAKDTLDGHHGSWLGAGFRATEGLVRNGLSFNGGSFGVQVPTDAALEVGLSDFSLELWVRTDQQPGLQTLFDARDGLGQGYRAALVDGQPSLLLDDGSTSHVTTTSVTVHDGRWHHLALVVERGAETRLYVDGDLVASSSNAAVIGSLSSGADLFLGRQAGTTADGLLGALDEVTLYHRALTNAEIASIHGAGCGGKHLPALSGGLVAVSKTVTM